LRRRPERLRRRPERPRPVLHLRRRRRRGSGEDLRGRGWVGPEGSGGGRWVGGGEGTGGGIGGRRKQRLP
jgi:hypothetical protein